MSITIVVKGTVHALCIQTVTQNVMPIYEVGSGNSVQSNHCRRRSNTIHILKA